MIQHADLLVYNASQLLTLASPGTPKRGSAMADPGAIPGGAVAIAGGRVLAVGLSEDQRHQVRAADCLDVAGRVVMPGFVDPHTHLVWAGDRAAEFEMRLQGKTYMEIMNAGGGIASTVRATREARETAPEELLAQTRWRLAPSSRWRPWGRWSCTSPRAIWRTIGGGNRSLPRGG